MRTAFAIKVATSSLAAALVVSAGIGFSGLSGASASTSHAVKMTLPKSIAPAPVFQTTGACGYSGPSNTAACAAMVLKSIDNGRTTEPLAKVPGSFSVAGFDSLTEAEQVFAIGNIERTARGLAPIAGLTTQLDAVALSAAQNQQDPMTPLPLRLTGGGEATDYGSNFAEGTSNAMGADYYWMYDDGLNSPNADCTKSSESGCWGHRENVLGDYNDANYCPKGSQVNTVMGAAWVTSGVVYAPSITEIFVNDCGALPTMDFTWADAQKAVFGS